MNDAYVQKDYKIILLDLSNTGKSHVDNFQTKTEWMNISCKIGAFAKLTTFICLAFIAYKTALTYDVILSLGTKILLLAHTDGGGRKITHRTAAL